MTHSNSSEATVEDPVPILHVCQTCASGGQVLFDALTAQADPYAVAIRGVRCLAACAHGCTATLSMPGKWAWLLGHLTPSLANDLLCYVNLYKKALTGTVMPSVRPASLRQSVLGRFPSLIPDLSSTEQKA